MESEQSIEELEASHRSFQGLIELAERAGAPQQEIVLYRESQRGLEIRIQQLKGAKELAST